MSQKLISNLRRKIKNVPARLYRKYIINPNLREQLQNWNFSILSSNCIGGVIYSDLGHPFLSPTINLWISAPDWISFLEKPKYYLSSNLSFSNSSNYPLGYIDNIAVHFIHYKSNEEAELKWKKRKNRINWENLFVIMTDRDGCTYELIERFNNLPYKKKAILTRFDYQKISSNIYIPGYEKDDFIGIPTEFINIKGKRVYEKGFDYISWLNNR